MQTFLKDACPLGPDACDRKLLTKCLFQFADIPLRLSPQPRQMADSTGYDSEAEDNPRKILNKSGDFYVMYKKDIVVKYGYKPEVKNADGDFVPFPGNFPLRPVPRSVALQKSREAMGNGTNGIWTATTFVPPAAGQTPQHVFPARWVASSAENHRFQRFCLRRRYAGFFLPSGIKTMCIFTDGACTNNGSTDVVPQAGCGFVFNSTHTGTIGFPLEKEGPDGIVYTHTSNRAELRAAICALDYRSWVGEGWERVVIVTDSEYVARGATEWMRTWVERGWRTARKKVQNRDLWELLSAKMGILAEGGCEVSFWAVPRDWNQEADWAAGRVAKGEGGQSYRSIYGEGV
jgi:ribonuclease HI